MHGRRLFGAALLCATFVAVAGSACSSRDTVCHSTAREAANEILAEWCDRYVSCDPSRGTVEDCVQTRLERGQVPGEAGCAESCTESTSDCQRSPCDDVTVASCADESKAMSCAAQTDGAVALFPDSCEACFSFGLF